MPQLRKINPLTSENHMNVNDTEIKELLKKYKKITVLGLSADTSKPSYKVPQYLSSKGYEIVGVNPKPESVSGFKCYKTLAEVPAEYKKFVDVFRRSENIPEVVEEVLKVGGVEVLWLQMGIAHPEAEKLAEQKGLKVISNLCLHLEHQKHLA